jgi:ribonuclease BN (tRNA processing enzyme)
MRLVTVGTGTVVPDPDRASACHWLEQGDAHLLVDCGAGALQGIPSLIFAIRHGLEIPRTAPLTVWGPQGTRRLFDAWAAALGAWLTEPGFEVTVREMAPDRPQEMGGTSVRVASTPHTEESLALRFEAAGASLGYTGDTGPSEELAGFFNGVDLLLAECSLPEELVGDNHLSPARLARLAVAAEVPRLAVTHVYPQLRGMDVAGLIRRAGYNGEIILAHDGLKLEV